MQIYRIYSFLAAVFDCTCCSSIITGAVVLDIDLSLLATVELTTLLVRLLTVDVTKLVTMSSYKKGFMTELIGRIIIEKMLYQGVASRISKE